MHLRRSPLRPAAAFVLISVLVLVTSSRPARAHTAFVYLHDDWRYDGTGTDLGSVWRDPGYDDSAWTVGESPLGGGSSSYGINFNTHIPIAQTTTYLRIAFDLDVAPDTLTSVTLGAAYAHGFVAYINGQEIARRSLPLGPIDASTPAVQHIPTDVEPIDILDPGSKLVFGKNVLAVELHQTQPATDLLVWAGSLSFTTSAQHVTRGPYLQMGTPQSIVVRWRTSVPTDSVVGYGPKADELGKSATLAELTTEHEVALTGLLPATKYYYAVGSSQGTLVGADEEHAFVTSPVVGTAAPSRFWVVGDAGTQDDRQREVRSAYYAYSADWRTDLWLMLGDNAYGEGKDEQYQYAVFERMYELSLQTAVGWPTIGNHDWQDGTDVDYFDIFTLPTQGEAGGIASGTERYYAFDYANVHFVCLHTDIAGDAEMMAWLEADLGATRQPWIVTFLHKPPYTKGSHDSDHEGDMDWIHQSVNPVLEAHGVDLVLGGHSHDYERSMLIDGHYGTSLEFAADPGSFTVNGGDGREDGDGVYAKPAVRGPHQGTVYVVAGNSGSRGEGATFPLDHPVMVELSDPHSGLTQRGLDVAGSLVLDLDGPRLDARYLDFEGTVLDSFTILKGTPPDPASGANGAGGGGSAGDASGAGAAAAASPGASREAGGCGCGAAGAPATGSWTAAALFLVALVRRRRT